MHNSLVEAKLVVVLESEAESRVLGSFNADQVPCAV